MPAAQPKALESKATSSHSNVGGYYPAVDAFARVAALLGPLNARCLELQVAVSCIGQNEVLVRQRELLNAFRSAQAFFAWPYAHQSNAIKLQEVTRNWIDFVSATQSAMTTIVYQSLAAGLADSAPAVPENKRPPAKERRTTAVVINFPDRRTRPR